MTTTIVNPTIAPETISKLQTQCCFSQAEMCKEFTKFDWQNRGSLDRCEFEQFLQHAYNLHPPKDAYLIGQLFSLFDRDHNGVIDYGEFSTALTLLNEGLPHDKLQFLFKIFDLNGDGYIERDEVEKIVTSLWENKLCKELFDFAIDERRIHGLDVFVDVFFRDADTNKDGKINLDEFIETAKKYTHPITDHKLKILPYQTGGHTDSFKKLDEGKIAKKVGQKEREFYESLDTKNVIFRPFAPRFFGIDNSHGEPWIIMEDLTSYFNHPCVMDIKMGVTSAGEDASAAKRAQMQAKDVESTTVSLGFRLTGTKVYQESTKQFVQYTKSFGRKLVPEQIEDALLKYFDNGIGIRYDVIPQFIEEMRKVLNLMETQSLLRFYSSSLLFLYDGDSQNRRICVKMIDFAHVHPITDGGKDEGYIFGLRNLISTFEKLANRRSIS